MNRREFLKNLALSPVAWAVGLKIAADVIREECLPPSPELKEVIESYSYTQNNYVWPNPDEYDPIADLQAVHDWMMDKVGFEDKYTLVSDGKRLRYASS